MLQILCLMVLFCSTTHVQDKTPFQLYSNRISQWGSSLQSSGTKPRVYWVVLFHQLKNSAILDRVANSPEDARIVDEMLSEWAKDTGVPGYDVETDPRFSDDSFVSTMFSRIKLPLLEELIRYSNLGEANSELSRSGTFDPTFLSLKTLQQELGLAQIKIETIEKKISKLNEKITELADKRIELLSKLDSKKLTELKKVLTKDQRRKFEQVVGKPINWYYLPEKPFFARQYVVPSEGHMGPKAREALGEKFNKRWTIPLAEIEKNPNINYIPVSLYHCLHSEEIILKELELSDSQQKAIEEVLEENLRDTGYAVEYYDDERIKNLVNGKVELPDYLDGLLVARQEEHLLQVELQVLLKDFEVSCFLTAPVIIKAFRISEEQLTQINEITEDYSQQARAQLEKSEKERLEMITDGREEVFSELSDSQFQRYGEVLPLSLKYSNMKQWMNSLK